MVMSLSYIQRTIHRTLLPKEFQTPVMGEGTDINSPGEDGPSLEQQELVKQKKPKFILALNYKMVNGDGIKK